LPGDHLARLGRARLALDGLSVGDAFGERFFVNPAVVGGLIASRALPAAPWRYTDDTVMALGILEVLTQHGRIDQDALARAFARRYVAAPDRGYGGGAQRILTDISAGRPWREVSRAAFGGQGSMGNGGAMRVALVGAYFADDIGRVLGQARASAEVTHAHPDGQAGAVAVAVAAAWAADEDRGDADELLIFVHAHTPPGPTRDGIARAMRLPADATPEVAAAELGSGVRVLSADTVPFALWCAARELDDFEAAMWTTVAGLGDRDTTCAIVGGMVAARDDAALPPAWVVRVEPLPRGGC
jgi:ADP-ribosylglycohydrolase